MSSPSPGAWLTQTWPHLPAGHPVTVLKRHPDGREGARYPAVVLDLDLPAPWVAVEAHWTMDPIEVSGLRFVPGDTLIELFSPEHPFNAFQVVAPDGQTRGWYANVTHPATLDTTTDPWTLTWPDLYLDLVGLPDGAFALRDEDELEDADLLTTDPALHAAILAAASELVRSWERRVIPFLAW